jgi:hypothetical protein
MTFAMTPAMKLAVIGDPVATRPFAYRQAAFVRPSSVCARKAISDSTSRRL